MSAEIVIRPIGNAPQFAPAEGEQKFNVGGRLGIEGELLLLMVSGPHLLILHAEGL